MWGIGLVGFVALALVIEVLRVRSRTRPLSVVVVGPDEVVVDIHAPAWLCFRRRLAAPRSAVVSARVVPESARLPLSLRLMGTGLPGFHLGYFRGRGGGVWFVVRRAGERAVEIDVTGGRVARWIVETPDPGATVAALTSPVAY